MEIGITPSNPEALEDDWVILGQALREMGGPDVTRRGSAGTRGLKSEKEASCRFATRTRWRPGHPAEVVDFS